MPYYAFFLTVLFASILSAAENEMKIVPARSATPIGVLGASAIVDVRPATAGLLYEKESFDGGAFSEITKETAACTISSHVRKKKARSASPLREVWTHEGNVLVVKTVAEKIIKPDMRDAEEDESQ
jgi:hypothetical protein